MIISLILISSFSLSARKTRPIYAFCGSVIYLRIMYLTQPRNLVCFVCCCLPVCYIFKGTGETEANSFSTYTNSKLGLPEKLNPIPFIPRLHLAVTLKTSNFFPALTLRKWEATGQVDRLKSLCLPLAFTLLKKAEDEDGDKVRCCLTKPHISQ